MGHREFLLCDNKLAQIHLDRQINNTRMRLPLKRLSCVLGMLSNLEVKVLWPT